jgi:hypothetical protein
VRILFLPFLLFIYVVADITANHGASVRGWIALASAVVRSVTRL